MYQAIICANEIWNKCLSVLQCRYKESHRMHVEPYCCAQGLYFHLTYYNTRVSCHALTHFHSIQTSNRTKQYDYTRVLKCFQFSHARMLHTSLFTHCDSFIVVAYVHRYVYLIFHGDCTFLSLLRFDRHIFIENAEHILEYTIISFHILGKYYNSTLL